MMKKNSKILSASVGAIFLMTATASANDSARIAIGIGGLILGEVIKNSGNNNNNRRGHTSLGPVNKQQQRSAPSKQAPKPRNNTPSAVAKSAPKAAPVAIARVADPQVLEAQKNLAALGFTEVGKPDGFAGKGTAEAVRAFQKSSSLPETGVLSATVIALIAKDAAKNTANPIEAITEVAEISKEKTKPDEIVVSQPVVEPAPVVEKTPEKVTEPAPTAVAQVAVPETKTPEPEVIEEPAATENEW